MVGSLKGINWILPLFICFSITPNYGLSQSASEEGRCSHIDLRESSFRNMRVFEQNSDDCFVYASVQMVDGWRFSHGDHNYDHQTSPIATAITATIDHPVENPVDIALGGMSGMCEVVDSIKSHGSCDLRSVSDKYGPLDLPDSRRNPQTFENFLSKMQKLYREDHAAYDLATKRRDHGKLKEIVKDFEGRACRIQAEIGVPAEVLPNADDLRKALELPRIDSSMAHVIAANCKPPHILRPPWPKYVGKKRISEPRCIGEYDRLKLPGLIGKILESGQPAGINYCANVLYRNPKYQGLNGSLLCDNRDEDGQPSFQDHASVVIGRRWNQRTQTCQYLVRNSWGDYCSTLKTKCEKEPAKYSCPWDCENGHQWVDVNSLEKNLKVVEYLTDRQKF